MLFNKILNEYNVSTILILPLFTKYTDKINIGKHKYTIFSLLMDNGLLDCYLYDEDDDPKQIPKTLKLLFDVSKIRNQFINDSYYYNILDFFNHIGIVDKIKVNEKYLVIYLTIEDEFKDDINHIINSNYSKVSDNYKKACNLAGNRILSKNLKDVNFIIYNNIPYKILHKSRKIYECLKEIFNITFEYDKNIEYFCGFNTDKEILKWQN